MITCAVHYEHRTSLPMDMGHLTCLTESGHDVHDDAVLFIVAGPAAGPPCGTLGAAAPGGRYL
jgi:hypothetical protein